jgi:hypothetical protein
LIPQKDKEENEFYAESGYVHIFSLFQEYDAFFADEWIHKKKSTFTKFIKYFIIFGILVKATHFYFYNNLSLYSW